MTDDAPDPSGFGESSGTASDGAAGSGAAGGESSGGEGGGDGEAVAETMTDALMATEPDPPIDEVQSSWGVPKPAAFAIRGTQKVMSALTGTGLPSGVPAIMDFLLAVLTAFMAGQSGSSDDEGEGSKVRITGE